jgi:hypothetical protein
VQVGMKIRAYEVSGLTRSAVKVQRENLWSPNKHRVA